MSTQPDPDDFMRAQPDALGDEPRVESFELHHSYGFASRPLDPDVGPSGEIIKACGLFKGSIGDSNHAWLAQDPRVTPKLPLIKKGESLQYGATGQFIRCHDDGRISMMTTDDATTNGKSVYFQVRPDGFHWVAPWGKIVFDATGYHLVHRSGARIDLGAIGGLPPPLDTLSSYFSVVAAIIKQEAAVAAEGTAAGVPEPVAKATSLLTTLTAIQNSLTAVQTALVSVGSALTALGNFSAGASITASGVAVAASSGALGTAALTIPSKSKQVT